MKEGTDEVKIPHPLVAVIPLAVLILLIVFVLNYLPEDALGGANQVALLIASAVCLTISMGLYRVPWQRFEDRMVKSIGDGSVLILILLLIGMMSSTWMISGVVPTLIYYGVQIMSPMFFLPCSCIISAVVSVMTGTSWTTIATVGIALMGIGDALGVPHAMTAGAIISGAYFGDKMSPLSDTTVLAASMSGSNLFRHIHYMMYTTVPSILIALLLYLFIGLQYDGEVTTATQYIDGLGGTFHISWLTMLVPAFTGILIYKKVSAIITLFLSSLAACVCAVILQPDVLLSIAEEEESSVATLFMGVMNTCYSQTAVDTGYDEINKLVSTRGMAGMLETVWLVICAMCFGSCMLASNMLKSLTRVFLKAVSGAFSLVFSSVSSGVLLNLVMGDQSLSIIMNASIFREEYERRGYKPELLSRSTEDSATVTSVLVPWTACGMTQSTVLGVSTIVYLPFCFFNLISPIMSCLVAALGFVPEPNVADAVESRDGVGNEDI